MKMTTWYQLLALHFDQDREGRWEDRRWTGGTKGKYSYGKHIRQRNALPSYWVTQTQDTHPSNQTHWERIARENKPKQKFILKDLFQWPCSSFSVDPKHTRRWDLNFIRCAGVYYKIPMALFFLLDILCFTSTVDLQQHYFYFLLIFLMKIRTLEPTFNHMQVTKLIKYYCCRL